MSPDGRIGVDSPTGKLWGFTSDIYESYSYLWKEGSDIYISLITVFSSLRHKGHFTSLVAAIHKCGFTVKVPCPSADMRDILRKKGFTEDREYDVITCEDAEVWVSAPPK